VPLFNLKEDLYNKKELSVLIHMNKIKSLYLTIFTPNPALTRDTDIGDDTDNRSRTFYLKICSIHHASERVEYNGELNLFDGTPINWTLLLA
jgi:hypothetical protein